MASYNPSQLDPPVFERRNYNSGKSSAESPRGINVYRLGCYVAECIAQEKDCDLVFLDGLNCPQHVEKFIRENPELQRGERAVIEYSYKGLLFLNFGGCKNDVFRGIIKKDKHYIEIEQASNADYTAQKLNCAGVQLSCGFYNEGSGVETVDEFSLNSIIADGFSYIRAIAEHKELMYIE
jgi:hypothetical protein